MEIIENIEELAPQVLFNFKNSGNNILLGSPNLFSSGVVHSSSNNNNLLNNKNRSGSGSRSSSISSYGGGNSSREINLLSSSSPSLSSNFEFDFVPSSPSRSLLSTSLNNSSSISGGNNLTSKPSSPLFPEVPNDLSGGSSNSALAPIPTVFSFGSSKNSLIPSSPLSNSSDALLGSSSEGAFSSLLSSSPSHSVPSSPPTFSKNNNINNNNNKNKNNKYHNFGGSNPISPSTSYSNLLSTSPNVSSASLQNAFNKSCTISSPNINNGASAPFSPSSNSNSSVQCTLNECLLCLRGQPEVLIKSPTWASIMRVVFFTLHNEMPEKQFFSLKTDVYDFMTGHWDVLCLNKKKSDNWHKQIQDMLSHSKNIFESGMDKFKQNGFWRLKQNIDPWVLPQKGNRKGSSSNCASPVSSSIAPPMSPISSSSGFVPTLGSPLMLSSASNNGCQTASPSKLYSRIFADEISISNGGRKRSLSAIDPHTSSSSLSSSSPSILSSPNLDIQMDLEIRKKRNSNSECYGSNSRSFSLHNSPLASSAPIKSNNNHNNNHHNNHHNNNKLHSSLFNSTQDEAELYIDDE